MNRQVLVAFLSGLMFGAGLAVSGMANPARVRAFLDIAGGAWDPTLAFVMGGALLPMVLAWWIKTRMARPLAAAAFDVPETRHFDPPLFVGAALFGIGWGIAGLCPGPALADLVAKPVQAALFVAAMLCGMGIHRLIPGRRFFLRESVKN